MKQWRQSFSVTRAWKNAEDACRSRRLLIMGIFLAKDGGVEEGTLGSVDQRPRRSHLHDSHQGVCMKSLTLLLKDTQRCVLSACRSAARQAPSPEPGTERGTLARGKRAKEPMQAQAPSRDWNKRRSPQDTRPEHWCCR